MSRATILFTALLGVAACGTEPRPGLLLTVDRAPPDTVREAEILIGGVAHRTDGSDAPRTVRAIVNGVTAAEVDASARGFFDVVVPIDRGSANTVVIVAQSEDLVSDSLTFAVQHESPLSVHLADTLPTVTSAAEFTVTGRAVRDPARAVPLIVSVRSGSATRSDMAQGDGSFAITVPLPKSNAANQLAVWARDTIGEVSAEVELTVEQDGIPPRILRITPSGNGAAVDEPIVIEFSESIRGGTVHVVDGRWEGVLFDGRIAPGWAQEGVAGEVTLSADARALVWTPDEALLPGTVHELWLDAVTDVAGNPFNAPAPEDACFVTAPVTGPGASSLSDAGDDALLLTGAAVTMPADLRAVTLGLAEATLGSCTTCDDVATQSVLTTLVEFAEPQSIFADDPANVRFAIEFDIDADPTTGYGSLRDFRFQGHPAAASGMTGADRMLYLSDAFDRALLLDYADFLLVSFRRDLYVPTCGTALSAVVPFGELQYDWDGANGEWVAVPLSGVFEWTAFGRHVESTGASGDPVPDAGVVPVDWSTLLASPAGPVLGTRRVVDTWSGPIPLERE
jgi:hypothetical protein